MEALEFARNYIYESIASLMEEKMPAPATVPKVESIDTTMLLLLMQLLLLLLQLLLLLMLLLLLLFEKQQATTSVNSNSDDMSLTNIERIIHRIEIMELEESQRDEKKRKEIETTENEYEKKKKEIETGFKMEKEEMQRKMHREKEEMENKFLKEKEELENRHRREEQETDEKCERDTNLFGQRTKNEILEFEKSFFNNKTEILERNNRIKEEHDREMKELLEQMDGLSHVASAPTLAAAPIPTLAVDPVPSVAAAPAEDLASSSVNRKPASAPECPICLEQMTPPNQIFSCTNGHKVCGECKETTPECFCRSAFVMRDIGFEAFVRELQ